MTDGNDDEIYDQAALIGLLPKEYRSSKPLFEGAVVGMLVPYNDGRKLPKMNYFPPNENEAELNKQTT